MTMVRSPHLIAGIVTVIAVIVFLVLKAPLGIKFGLRTWWPAFFIGYLMVWYYGKVLRSRI